MVPWLVAMGSLAAFVALWLRTTYRELLPLREAVWGADKQVRLYWNLLSNAEEDLEKKDYMKDRYDIGCAIYLSQARRYNETLQSHFNAPVAWILGFHLIPEVIEFDLSL